MQSPLEKSRLALDPNAARPEKKPMGCLAKSLIAVAILLVVVVGGGWILVMHTSLPLRVLAATMEAGGADDHLKITGISGSLSSGVTFKKMTWDDGEITDFRFRYSGIMDVIFRKELILHEVHVASAKLEMDFSNSKPGEEGETASTEVVDGDDSSDDESPLRLFQIDHLSLNNLTLTDRVSRVTVRIPKVEWTGFKAEQGRDLELGNIRVESDVLNVRTTALKSGPYQSRFEITVMPKMHAMILQPISIVVDAATRESKLTMHLRAFEDAVNLIVGDDEIGHLRVEGLDLADFFDGPLPQELRLHAEIGNSETQAADVRIHGGGFRMGTKVFEIEPAPSGAEVMVAVAGGEELEFRYEILLDDSGDDSSKPLLAVTPWMTPEDTLAMLYHGVAFADLAEDEQARMGRWVSWFSFSEEE